MHNKYSVACIHHSTRAVFGINMEQYTLIHQGDSIVLALMHDENHLEPICIFPKEQYQTAKQMAIYLNNIKFGMGIPI